MHIFANAAIDNVDHLHKHLLYQCPEKYQSSIQSLIITNINPEQTSAQITVTVFVYRLNKFITVLNSNLVSHRNSLVVERVINLMENDQIFLQSNSENSFSVYASILEVK